MNLNPHPSTITIRCETPDDHDEIEDLGAKAFGPGRFTRAAFRLREGVTADPVLSFVALNGGKLIGSVRLTPVRIGARPALLLGPLVVDSSKRNLGTGRELMNRALHDARAKGHEYVILVGDLAYYAPFGFERIPVGCITLPGPADPLRILGCELRPGTAKNFAGPVVRWYD